MLERLRYLFIASSNIDEFFEIRVAGIKQQVEYKTNRYSIDGLTPSEILSEISKTTHALSSQIYAIYNNQLIPSLEKNNIFILEPNNWDESHKKWLEQYFIKEILPVVSPIGLDLAKPFPRLVNKSLNFLVSLKGDDAFGRNIKYAVIHAPRALPRAILLPSELTNNKKCFVYLSTIMKAYLHHLFSGMTITGCYSFRLTRNSDLFLREEEIDDLVSALKDELFARNYGDAVRLEIDSKCPEPMVQFLLKKHKLTPIDVYLCEGPVNLQRYMEVLDQINLPSISFKGFQPVSSERLKSEKSIFEAVEQNDIVLHHPYESFQTVIELIREAARAGKEVTAVIELRARFDEESNIILADTLIKAGALVLYGVVGYKTHAKMTLIVRRQNDGLKNFVHLGTGNYHERTAKSYTDLGLLTANPILTQDVQNIFHQITGPGKEIKLIV